MDTLSMDLQGDDRTRYSWLFIVVGLQVLAWIAILCVFRLEVVWMTAFVPGVTFAIGRSMINGSLREDRMGAQFMRVIACGLSGGISAVAITLAFLFIMCASVLLGMWGPHSVSFQFVPLIIIFGSALQFIVGFVAGVVTAGALEIAVAVVKIAAGQRTPDL